MTQEARPAQAPVEAARPAEEGAALASTTLVNDLEALSALAEDGAAARPSFERSTAEEAPTGPQSREDGAPAGVAGAEGAPGADDAAASGEAAPPPDPLEALEAAVKAAQAEAGARAGPGEGGGGWEEEEDPLEAARRLQAAREAELEAARDVSAADDAALRDFFKSLKEADQENEVMRILGAFRLNPYEALGVRFDAGEEDIRRAYRKSSLAVHPDKCRHPDAKAAFELLGDNVRALEDPGERAKLDALLAHARGEVLAAWKKGARASGAAGNAVRLAAALDGGDRLAVQARYERSDEFHESWKARGRDILARFEWRRRTLTKRIAETEERAKKEHKEEKEKAITKAREAKRWDKSRDQRAGSWRDFLKAGAGGGGGTSEKKKRKGDKLSGGIKPPKLKAEDPGRAYVQRAVAEQARPGDFKRIFKGE